MYRIKLSIASGLLLALAVLVLPEYLVQQFHLNLGIAQADTAPAPTPLARSLTGGPAIGPGCGYNPICAPSASVDAFRRYLTENQSPAAPEAEAMYVAIRDNGGDPAVALGFFDNESTLGKFGVAATNHGIGNIRCTSDYLKDPNNKCLQGFRYYDSWAKSGAEWAQLLQFYKSAWGLVTLEQILPKYAPWADRNNPVAYTSHVKQVTDVVRAMSR